MNNNQACPCDDCQGLNPPAWKEPKATTESLDILGPLPSKEVQQELKEEYGPLNENESLVLTTNQIKGYISDLCRKGFITTHDFGDGKPNTLQGTEEGWDWYNKEIRDWDCQGGDDMEEGPDALVNRGCRGNDL